MEKIVECFGNKCNDLINKMQMTIMHYTAGSVQFHETTFKIIPSLEFDHRNSITDIRIYLATRTVFDYLNSFDTKTKKVLASIINISKNQTETCFKQISLALFNGSVQIKTEKLNEIYTKFQKEWTELIKQHIKEFFEA